MRQDLILAGGVILALAAAVLLVLWLQPDGVPEGATVPGLGGPFPSAPVAPPPAPAPAPPPLEPASMTSSPESLSVYFEFDRAELRAAEAAKLDGLLKRDFKRIEAVGHADRIGPAAYNLELSERRAAAVKRYLVEQGVGAQVITRAKGELEPRSGDACIDMGPERRHNERLVVCLQPDRRVELNLAG